MEPIDYINIILRRKWIALISFFVAIAAMSIKVLLTEPVYESECKVLLVNDNNANALANYSIDDIMMQSTGKSDPVSTQIEILKTRPILEETIRRCDIRNKNNESVEWDIFLKRFNFTSTKTTNIIKITYQDIDRQKVPVIVNTLAQVFAEQNQRFNQEEMTKAKEFIEKQIIIQKSKVEEAEQLLMSFKANTRTISFDKETSVQINTIASLEGERVRLESEFKGIQAQKSDIEGKLNISSSQASPFYSSLITSKEQAAISISNLNARIQEIRRELNCQYGNLKNLPPLEIQLARLMREEQIMNEVYTNLLAKSEEYKIREAARVSSIKIIEPAIQAKFPVLPNKKKSLALAGLIGLAIGFFIALTLEYLRDRPRSIDEIKKILNTNLLGSIPYFNKEFKLFLIDNPSSLPSEAIRIIHTNLKFKDISDRPHISLMTTSAQPGEGKTTITANLAIVFANMGKRTALVNFDLRRPSFEKIFNKKFKRGITEYLIGESDLENISYSFDNVENLTIFPEGQIPPNPTELLGTKKMADFIKKLNMEYDVVLFDTAPITMIAESLDIARSMDGIILVADVLQSSRRGLMALHEILNGKNLSLLGVIANKLGKDFLGNYKYGYYRYNAKSYSFAKNNSFA